MFLTPQSKITTLFGPEKFLQIFFNTLLQKIHVHLQIKILWLCLNNYLVSHVQEYSYLPNTVLQKYRYYKSDTDINTPMNSQSIIQSALLFRSLGIKTIHWHICKYILHTCNFPRMINTWVVVRNHVPNDDWISMTQLSDKEHSQMPHYNNHVT